MATFKTISSADIKTTKTVLNQLIDFVEEDVSGSTSRKSYQVFVTGSGAYAVTSSLFQTVFDQNFSLQTANELFDITYGVFSGSTAVAAASTGIDTNGKILFTSQSVMMREKINVYRQFAQTLLGNSDSRFRAPFSSTSAVNDIDNPLFLCFKRLFVRDGIKRETFAMRFFQSASGLVPGDQYDNIFGQTAGRGGRADGPTRGAFGYCREPVDAFQVNKQAGFGSARSDLRNQIGCAGEDPRVQCRCECPDGLFDLGWSQIVHVHSPSVR